jgi:tetratricopeptide (TPR) repeat protein
MLLAFFGATVGQSTKPPGDEACRHFELGKSAYAIDNPIAEQEFKEAIRLRNGRYPEAWEMLAAIYGLQFRLAEQADAYGHYIQQSPDPAADEVELSQKYRRAAGVQTQLDRGDRPPLEDLVEFVNLAMQSQGPAKAYEFAERAALLYPEAGQPLILMVRYLPAKYRERRLGLIQRAMTLCPLESEVWAEQGSIQFSQRDYDSALASFRKALELSQNKDAYMWDRIGDALAAQGRREEAIAAFRNYLRLAPGTPEMRAGVRGPRRSLRRMKSSFGENRWTRPFRRPIRRNPGPLYLRAAAESGWLFFGIGLSHE